YIFVGYTEHYKAYKFYVIEPNDSVSIDSTIESRDAIFDENYFSSIPRPKDIIPNFDESQRDDHSNDVPSETLEPCRGKRARIAKSYGFDFQLYLVEGSKDQIGSQYFYHYRIEENSRTYNEAMQSRDATFWKEAIDNKIGSMMENNTWVLSDLPPGCRPLGCKWIFKRKMKVDGTIDKFKARLVIQGFRQKERIDYIDTYALVARITTIRFLLALVAIHNLVIHQMDVKRAFLNGDLKEEMYMKQLEGFVMPGNEHKVCKLVKSLYGLKQVSKHLGDSGSVYVILVGQHWHHCNNKGMGVLLGRLSFLWASKKQTCITGSTIESEFVALAAAGVQFLDFGVLELDFLQRIYEIARDATNEPGFRHMYNRRQFEEIDTPKHIILHGSMTNDIPATKTLFTTGNLVKEQAVLTGLGAILDFQAPIFKPLIRGHLVFMVFVENNIPRGYTTWNYHGEESDDDDGGDDVPFDGSDGGTDDMSDDDLDKMLDNIGVMKVMESGSDFVVKSDVMESGSDDKFDTS
ncbi:zinc finger, CCHC-type containing protein, partial [Tanacetum coccineum]